MPKRIVVMDDNVEILQLFKAVLEEEGNYTVEILHHKPEIMSILEEADPDLIILDYLFDYQPDGWTIIQKLKLNRQTARIPVIICSAASKQIAEITELLKAKDVAILMKPFDIDELLTLVDKTLESHAADRTARDDERQMTLV